MKKMILLAVCLIGSISLSVSAARAESEVYVGGWNIAELLRDGRELLILGDSSDNTYRLLGGTTRACDARGDSYSYVRRIVSQSSGDQVAWQVVADCGDIVRVCVRNVYSNSACSTYLDLGWTDRMP